MNAMSQTMTRSAPIPAMVWLLLAALLFMFVPTFIDVARTFWQNERGTAGPLILAICAWLIWGKRDALMALPQTHARPLGASGLLAFGLVCYVIGRSQALHVLEVGSLIPVCAAIIMALRGTQGLRIMWFALFFLLFVIPLPGSLLDAILVPLKQQVSAVSESIMYALGFPVARSGVVISIGQYQLLIADACSGLSSMISLTGIGLVYVYMARNSGIWHNALLLLAVLPIAFVANIVRVCLLMWVTYAYGESAGQNFHDQAGYLEIVLAFALFFGLDALINLIRKWVAR
jgi:exosortase B